MYVGGLCVCEGEGVVDRCLRLNYKKGHGIHVMSMIWRVADTYLLKARQKG